MIRLGAFKLAKNDNPVSNHLFEGWGGLLIF